MGAVKAQKKTSHVHGPEDNVIEMPMLLKGS